ncbi:MAG TPA: dihydrofolate reductase family protein [Actinomycetes bacterium]|nr:dihydrofolate reductase family protein [Actinomycetes bacterium]
MRRLLPSPEEDVEVEPAYAVPDATPWLRASMVTTLDGSVAGPDGRSGSISGPADKAVFAALRAGSDAVLVGAGTASAEGYGPSARPIVVVSNRIGIDLARPLFTEARHRTVLLTARSAPAGRLEAAREVAEVVLAGEERVDLTAGLAALRARGMTRIVCEGGPSLLAGLLADGLVDELCTTTSPLVVGGDGSRMVRGPWLPTQPWRLAQLLTDDGFLFARWQRP